MENKLLNKLRPKTKPAIGIVLSHQYARMAVWQNDRLKMISDDTGHSVIPLMASFTNNKTLFGTKAEENLIVDPSNTVINITELLGKSYNEIENKIKSRQCKVVDGNGKILIEVKDGGKIRRFSVDQIYLMIIQYLKKTAEQFLKISKITKVVIATPVLFTEKQLKTVKWAMEESGFNILFMMNEPVASVISFQLSLPKKVLVFSLNRYSLEVTVLQKENSNYKILSTFETFDAGGEHLNTCLIEYVVKKFKKKSNIDLSTNKDVMKNLWSQCEMTKTVLTSVEASSIKLNFKDYNFDKTITRLKFETVCDTIFTKTINAVEHVLLESKLEKSEIDEIILVGGPTKIPKIRQLLSTYFFHKQLLTSIRPHETIAHGVALMAAFFNKENVKIIENLNNLVISNIPVTFGFVIEGEKPEIMILPNTIFPVSKSKDLSILFGKQKYKQLNIIGDQNQLNKDSHFFTTFSFFKRDADDLQIKITFSIDVSGNLLITIIENNANKQNFAVNYESIRLYLNEQNNKQLDKCSLDNTNQSNSREKLFYSNNKILNLENTNSKVTNNFKSETNKWPFLNEYINFFDDENQNEVYLFETLKKVFDLATKTKVKLNDMNLKLNYFPSLNISLSTQEKQLKQIFKKINKKYTPIIKKPIYKITKNDFSNAKFENSVLCQNSKGNIRDININSIEIDIDCNDLDEETENQQEKENTFQRSSIIEFALFALFGVASIFIFHLKQNFK